MRDEDAPPVSTLTLSITHHDMTVLYLCYIMLSATLSSVSVVVVVYNHYVYHLSDFERLEQLRNQTF